MSISSDIAFTPTVKALQAERGALDLQRFADHVRAEHLPHAVILDCSASDEVANHYERWLARGIHVVAANKLAGSGPLARHTAIYRRLVERIV